MAADGQARSPPLLKGHGRAGPKALVWGSKVSRLLDSVIRHTLSLAQATLDGASPGRLTKSALLPPWMTTTPSGPAATQMPDGVQAAAVRSLIPATGVAAEAPWPGLGPTHANSALKLPPMAPKAPTSRQEGSGAVDGSQAIPSTSLKPGTVTGAPGPVCGLMGTRVCGFPFSGEL